MITDSHGNILSNATQESADLLDQAVRCFNIYRGDPFGPLDRAMELAPRFVMAPIAKALLFAMAAEPGAVREAAALLEKAKKLTLSEREASTVAVIEKVIAGEWTAAARLMDRHNANYPRDLLALQAGHVIDFYNCNARSLRDRIARALPKWSPDRPGYSLLLGMHAFGLEETGDYARAEESGRKALDLDPADCWAHHAVAHVMEMQGRAQDGIGWMIAREPHWTGDDNFFQVHNWWHRALFHLDLNQTEEVLALYDGPIRQGRSLVALDMIDASAMLWRLTLSGLDVGHRWDELATAWDNHADGRTYPFNDWHAVMAYLGAGRQDDVERLMTAWRNSAGGSEAAAWGARFALPLVEGFTAFWRGQYDRAVDLLMGGRYVAYAFGGSNAQRDIIDWTLTEAAIRGNRAELAQALAAERHAAKPHSPVHFGLVLRADATKDRKAA
jgi:tetratricopeptide (TPR) repeat protein